MSLQPVVIGRSSSQAIVSTILWARRERKPVGQYEMVSLWWLLPLLGSVHVLRGIEVPGWPVIPLSGSSLLPVHERYGGDHAA